MGTNSSANLSTTDQTIHLATSEILFSRILVATDFSKPAHQALKVAITLSQNFGAKLYLVHASVATPWGAETGPLPVEVLDAELEADKEEMQQLVQNEPELRVLSPRVVVAYSEPINLIQGVSTEEGIDLIVVGSHGASGLERLVLGSVAEAVMRHTTCPVMIVGPNCTVEQHPFRSVLFATDLKTTGLRAAQYASALAERFHGKLTILHVADPNFEDHKKVERVKNHIQQQLAELTPSDVAQYCETQMRLEYGKPAETITSIARMECASMIVVGLRDRALADHATWSTLSYLIREARCPVLGVRDHLA